MWDKLRKTGMYGVWVLLTLLTATITLMSLIRISSDAEWILKHTNYLPLVLLCGSFVLGVFITGLARWLLNMPERYIRWVTAALIGLFVLGEGIMLRMFYVLPNTDTCVVEDCAMALLKGLIQTIDEHSSYFWFYGNNYLQVLLTKALFFLMYAAGGAGLLRLFKHCKRRMPDRVRGVDMDGGETDSRFTQSLYCPAAAGY